MRHETSTLKWETLKESIRMKIFLEEGFYTSEATIDLGRGDYYSKAVNMEKVKENTEKNAIIEACYECYEDLIEIKAKDPTASEAVDALCNKIWFTYATADSWDVKNETQEETIERMLNTLSSALIEEIPEEPKGSTKEKVIEPKPEKQKRENKKVEILDITPKENQGQFMLF